MCKEERSWIFDSLDAIRAAFSVPGIKVISFDFFDTLVVRPLAESLQLFDLLDLRFRQLSPCRTGFRKLRTEAEAVMRRRLAAGKPAARRKEEQAEDFPLEDICRVLAEEFSLGETAAQIMMEEERKAEIRFSARRESGFRLLEAAKAAGKQVVILSDMYLREQDIRNIAEHCGVCGFDRIFVSSETGKRKLTGSLYTFAAEQLGIRPAEMFHIGDSEEIDCRMAVGAGCRAALLTGAMDAYLQRGCARQPEKICRDLTDWEAACRSPGIGIMRRMAANFYFDDPFRPFAEGSAYNGDPVFAGYAALGAEILALVRWLSDEVRRDGISRLLFAARDGYLPMRAYELYRRYHPDLPPAGYLHISRMAMLPVMIASPQDLYDLPTDVRRQTPRKLRKLLNFCRKENAAEESGPAGDPDGFFTPASFQAFISAFIREEYDPEVHQRSKNRVAEYLRHNDSAPVTEGTGLFDMGYSGRTAAAAADAAGVFLPVYYFQTEPSEHFRQEARAGIRIRSFLDFSPYMEASFREYAYLAPEASCIGYTGDMRPVFDEGPAPGYAETVLALQKGALQFLEDFMDLFSEYEDCAGFRGHDAAIPFEAFLRFCGPEDMKMFDGVLLDDELWGGRRNISLPDLVRARLRKLPPYARGENC